MRTLSKTLLALSLVLAPACGGDKDADAKGDAKKADKDKKGGDAKAGGGDAKAAPAPAGPAYTGPLDPDKLTAAKDKVKPNTTWDEAKAALIPVIGEPVKSEGNRHVWAALEDDDQCVLFAVEVDDAGKVSSWGTESYADLMKEKFEACKAAVR